MGTTALECRVSLSTCIPKALLWQEQQLQRQQHKESIYGHSPLFDVRRFVLF